MKSFEVVEPFFADCRELRAFISRIISACIVSTIRNFYEKALFMLNRQIYMKALKNSFDKASKLI